MFAILQAHGMGEVSTHHGMNDASAAVGVGELFIAANDEDNVLRVFSRGSSGRPMQTFPLDGFLRPDPEKPEADIEGACERDGVVYWITSHGRNKNGKDRPSRRRFFATRFKEADGILDIEFVGQPYLHLLSDLLNEEALSPYNLESASTRAPKSQDALNIEGLGAAPDGGLLIGFRNPIPEGKALIVPLENPNDLIHGEGPARFGPPRLLDLSGLGIRSIASYPGGYLIVAGPYDSGGGFKLFQWSGADDPPQEIEKINFEGFAPEGIIIYPDLGLKRVQFLSDDGTLPDNRPGAPSFRSFWAELKGTEEG